MRKTRILCLTAALLFVLPLLCLTACELNFGAKQNNESQTNPNSQVRSAQFVARVKEIHEKQLFVEVIQSGTSNLGENSPVYVSTNFESYTTVAVGDYIIVVYDTMVQEIYPPIVPNVFSITKCDANGNPLK